jgi:alpha-L-rhamnosidase
MEMKKIQLLMIIVLCGIAAASAALPEPVADEQLLRRTTEDPRVRRLITPSRVLWQSDTGVENAKGLLEVRDGQATLETVNPVILRSTGSQQAGILLDFGVQIHGGIQIVAFQRPGKGPVRVRVRFGESASEAMSELGGKTNATNDHAIRDQTTLVPWLGAAEIGNTGFRFVRIDLDEPDCVLPLKSVRAVFVYRDIEYKGSFRSSCERLNKIWDVGAYTVHLNMQEYLWDGIKRDRLVWVGDMHPETMAIFAAFGAHEVVPKSLDMVRDVTSLPAWMNGISSYSMWWILLHHSWYDYTADKVYLEQQRGYLTKLALQLSDLVGPDNKEKLPPIRFLDWPTRGDEQAEHAGLHAMLVMALEASAELCDVLGEQKVKHQCLAAVERLRKHIPNPGRNKQAAALMVLAGLDDPDKLNKEVMAADGAKRMSTFYGYYVLQARAKAGDYQGCLDVIRQYWGGMLDLGATTFWEDFDLDWTKNAARIDELVPEGKKDIHGDFGAHCYIGFRHSLCHGWAAGPTAWMSEHILGIKIIEPGCRTIKIEPNLGDLEWAEGTYPTPHGIIRIRHEKAKDGTTVSTVQAPDTIRIVYRKDK